MVAFKKIKLIQNSLLEWYNTNGRQFPWRNKDASIYQVIISEILLQRTKAITVAKYYDTFFAKYPNWDSLCNATIGELEEIMRPLGLYKHRANRLYKLAQGISKREGKLPKQRDTIEETGFTGLYIANAYELFALNKKKPLLDVNMSRFLKRFFKPGKFIDIRQDKEIQEIANSIVKVTKCKELNWAILDYASQVCTSQKPLCSICKLNSSCAEYIINTDEQKKTVEDYQISMFKQNQDVESFDTNKTIRVLSLFSGCGGMDLGFEGGFKVHEKSINKNLTPDYIDGKVENGFIRLSSTEFKTVFANDILKEARTAWVNHFTKLGYDQAVFHTESIVDIVKAHKSGIKIFPDDVDIVTGGFPCQDFSIAGKRKGFESHKDHNGIIHKDDVMEEETRGKLYTWMRQVVEITKPKIFIAENVKGLVNLSNVKDIIQKDFSTADENGYIVLEPQVLHAANYGVPQSRERVIFIGIRKSALNKKALENLEKKIIPEEYNPYPKPTHSYNLKIDKLTSAQTCKNIFSHLEEPILTNDLSQKYYSKAKYMGTHCQGQTEINLDSIAPTIRAEHHGNIEYRRLAKEHGGLQIQELEQGLEERRLTPRECALIQTFPPDYEFVIPKQNNNTQFLLSPSSSYKIIGNAVPPLLAYHIAKRIEKLWGLYFE